MLNKEVCISCVNSKANGNEIEFWFGKDDTMWDADNLYCPAYAWMTISKSAAFKLCPKKLEHAVAETLA